MNPGPTTAPPEAGSLIGLVAMFLRHPRLLTGLPLAFAIAAGAIALVRGPEYIARAELKPQSADAQLANISGLAAQFGVNVAGLGGAEGVEYYAAVLRSNEILGAVASSSFRFTDRTPGDSTGDSLSGTLMHIWDISGPTQEVRQAAAIRRLRSLTTPRANLQTGLVRFEVRARWPELAVLINRRFIEQLTSFNIETRRSQAAAQRQFVERRLGEMRAELTAVENALLAFESRNRLQLSPDLALERARLSRRVELTNQVYLTLAQAYEQARMDEVRDTPVITVVDAPENTVERAGGLLLFVVLGGCVGVLFAIGAVLIGELWARQLADRPDEADALTTALRALPRKLLGGRSVSA